MEIEQATIIALASVTLSALSPAINSAVSAASQRRMFMAQQWASNAREAISEYLKWASVQVNTPSSTFMGEYSKAYGEVFLYAPKSVQDDMRTLNELIQSKKAGEGKYEIYNRIVDAFSSHYADILKRNK